MMFKRMILVEKLGRDCIIGYRLVIGIVFQDLLKLKQVRCNVKERRSDQLCECYWIIYGFRFYMCFFVLCVLEDGDFYGYMKLIYVIGCSRFCSLVFLLIFDLGVDIFFVFGYILVVYREIG